MLTFPSGVTVCTFDQLVLKSRLLLTVLLVVVIVLLFDVGKISEK